MHTKSLKSEVDLKNLNVLSNVKFIIGLPCILPLLECVHTLIKVTQNINVFVCDFVESINLTQQEFYRFYYDSFAMYEDPSFEDFNLIKALTNEHFPLSWFLDLNVRKDSIYLAFSFANRKYLIYQSYVDGLGEKQLVTKDVFYHAINKVKEECEGVVQSLIDELHRQFPTHKVMTTLGVVYPQFWATNGDEVKENFHTYLAI
jgi:hypothetical protein